MAIQLLKPNSLSRGTGEGRGGEGKGGSGGEGERGGGLTSRMTRVTTSRGPPVRVQPATAQGGGERSHSQQVPHRGTQWRHSGTQGHTGATQCVTVAHRGTQGHTVRHSGTQGHTVRTQWHTGAHSATQWQSTAHSDTQRYANDKKGKGRRLTRWREGKGSHRRPRMLGGRPCARERGGLPGKHSGLPGAGERRGGPRRPEAEGSQPSW